MRVQRVLMPDGAESWTVLDDAGELVAPIEAYLAHLQAFDRSPNTVRTYATSLKLWFEFLVQVLSARQIDDGIDTPADDLASSRCRAAASTVMTRPSPRHLSHLTRRPPR